MSAVKKTSYFFLLISLLCIQLLFLNQLYDVSKFNVFQIRDLMRAEQLYFGESWSWFGPELSGGGRIFGNALYALIGLPLVFGGDWMSSWYLMIFLSACSATLAFAFFRKEFGLWPAVLVYFAPLLSKAHLETISNFYNPSFLDLFLVGLLISVFYTYKKSKSKHWWLSCCVLIFIAVQLHVSVLIFLPFLVLLNLLTRRWNPPQLPWPSFLLGMVFAYSPIWAGMLLHQDYASEEGFILWSGLDWYLNIKFIEWHGSISDLSLKTMTLRLQDLLTLPLLVVVGVLSWITNFHLQRHFKNSYTTLIFGSLCLLSFPLGATFLLSGYDVRYLQVFNFSWMFFIGSLSHSLLGPKTLKPHFTVPLLFVLLGMTYLSINKFETEEITHPRGNLTFSDVKELADRISLDWGLSWREAQLRLFYLKVLTTQSPQYFFKVFEGPLEVSPLAGIFVLSKRDYPGEKGWMEFLAPDLRACFEAKAYEAKTPIELSQVVVIYGINANKVPGCPLNVSSFGFQYNEDYFQSKLKPEGSIRDHNDLHFTASICESPNTYCQFGLELPDLFSNKSNLTLSVWGAPLSLSTAWFGPNRTLGAKTIWLELQCKDQSVHQHLVVEALGAGVNGKMNWTTNNALAPALFSMPNYCLGDYDSVTLNIKELLKSSRVFYQMPLKIGTSPNAFQMRWDDSISGE